MQIVQTNTMATATPSILVYGSSGVGKTTLLGTLPHEETLIIDVDRGLASLGHASIDTIQIGSDLGNLKEVVEAIVSGSAEMAKYRADLDGGLKANCREFDETNEEYCERVADWYAEEPRVHVQLVRRNPEQLDLQAKQTQDVNREIDAATHLDRFYPNPVACSIMPCPFAAICLESTPDAIEGLYTVKKDPNEESPEDEVPVF